MAYSLQIEMLSYKENADKLIADFDDELPRDPTDQRRATRSSRSLAQMMGGGTMPPNRRPEPTATADRRRPPTGSGT